MPHDNPYAPPSTATELPPPGPSHQQPRDAGTLSLSSGGLSPYGLETVTSLAQWMRIVSTLITLFGLLFLGSSVFFAILLPMKKNLLTGGLGSAGLSAASFIYGLFLILGAIWLRRAARHFVAGVQDNATSGLAQGFANLRRYLILYGLLQLAGLAMTLAQLATR